MIVTAAGEAHHETIMLLLMLASVGTFLSIGLKLPAGTWFGPDRGLTPRPAPRSMYAGMGLVALLCFFFGVVPAALYRYLPYPVEYHPFTGAHLVETVQMLALTFVGFWLLRRRLAPHATVALDADWFYRRPAPVLRRWVVAGTDRAFLALERWGDRAAAAAARRLRNPAPALQRFLGAPGADPDKAFDADDARPALAAAGGLLLLAFVVFGIVTLT
jgi:multicomponent Na+:H+ antiporter subunit D